MTFHTCLIKAQIGGQAVRFFRRLNLAKVITHFMLRTNSWNNRYRVLAWMVYLNDVPEGGETEFLYQQVKIKPTANTLVIYWIVYPSPS